MQQNERIRKPVYYNPVADEDILAYLMTIDNYSAYVRTLIRDDKRLKETGLDPKIYEAIELLIETKLQNKTVSNSMQEHVAGNITTVIDSFML